MTLNFAILEKKMPAIYLRFYAVGVLLFMVPLTRPFFIAIITLSLLLVFSSAFAFARDLKPGTVGWGMFVVVSAFGLEYYGVSTGKIFGQYAYGRGLAPLLKATPLIIGFNWLFLIYATHLIAARLTRTAVGRILVGALLMVGYDLVAEWVAPYMDMWTFGTGYPPFRNFVVWFVASLMYHTGFELFPLRHDNPTARMLYGIQLLFFLAIGIFSTLVIR